MASRQRRLVTASTLLAGVLVLGLMAIIGYRNLTAPFDTGGASPKASGCPSGEHEVVKATIRRHEVKVSVFNAGGVKGAAGNTLDKLEKAAFLPGEVGNAPSDMQVETAKVYTTEVDDPGAELVARFMGRDVQVVHTDEEFGPGIDVFIGKKLGKLNPDAPRWIKLKTPTRTCVAD